MNFFNKIYSKIIRKSFSYFSDLVYRSGDLQEFGSSRMQIEKGYKAVVWIYACINMIAAAASRIPMKIKQQDGQFIDLAKVIPSMLYPNNFQTFQEMRYAFIANTLITGNGYIRIIKQNDFMSGLIKRPFGFITLPSQLVSTELNKEKNDIIYKYDMEGSQKTLLSEEVIHFKKFNPTSLKTGLSAIEVLKFTVETTNSSKEWNNNLIKNDARPAGMVKVKGILTEPERNRFEKVLRDNFLGAKNAGLPFVGEGDIDWVPFSFSPKDIDWIGQMKIGKEEIATALNVPLQLLNSQEASTFSNYEQAMRALYTNNILPLVEMEAQLYTKDICRMEYGLENYSFEIDRDSVPELQEDKTEVWNRINASSEMTLNEKRIAKGLEPIPDPMYDEIFIPSNLWPLSYFSTEDKENE